MTLIVCLEERGGLLFFHKRLSRDRAVYDDILHQKADGARLVVTPYSAALFPPDSVTVTTDPLHAAKKDDLYFAEDGPLPDTGVEKLVVYGWNRRYPFDRAFPLTPEQLGLSKCEETEFAGFSHERITKTVYEKRDRAE